MRNTKDQRKLIISEINNASQTLGALRKEESILAVQEKGIISLQESDADLKSMLEKVLPPNLVPSNIGDFRDISYPTFYELEFDFTSGGDVVFDNTNEVKKFFQIGSEFGFLLSNITRSYDASDLTGEGAPLEVNFRNKESSRQFNDNPVLLQHIATRGKKMPFTIPMFLHPLSKLEVSMRSWFEDVITVGGVTTGKQRLIFTGRRVDMASLVTLSKRVFK